MPGLFPDGHASVAMEMCIRCVLISCSVVYVCTTASSPVIHRYCFALFPLPRAERQLRDSISSFQNAYLSRSLSQLLDHINLSFPSGSKDPPATKDLTNLIKTISR